MTQPQLLTSTYLDYVFHIKKTLMCASQHRAIFKKLYSLPEVSSAILPTTLSRAHQGSQLGQSKTLGILLPWFKNYTYHLF